jgi:hypothetical protein
MLTNEIANLCPVDLSITRFQRRQVRGGAFTQGDALGYYISRRWR